MSADMKPLFFFLFLLFLFCLSSVASDKRSSDERPATNEPQFVSQGGQMHVKEGQELIELACEVHDLGEFVILWKFNRTQVLFAGNLRIHRDDRISRDDQKGSLLIRDFSAENAGEYSCQISTNPPQEIVYTLALIGPPLIRAQPSNGQITVRRGERFVLRCDTSSPNGTDNEDVVWRKNGRLLNASHELVVERTRIEVLAQREDAGLYECVASNSIGQTAFQFRVHVMYPPEVTTDHSVVHAPIGHSLTIECTVYAEPSANVVWFNRNHKILPNDNFRFGRHNQTSSLTIANVTQELYDNYTCVANNTFGDSQRTIEVTGRPSKATFLSPQLSADDNGYWIEWTIDSQTDIESYELRIRRLFAEENALSDDWQTNSWQHLHVEPNDAETTAGGVRRRQKFRIENLAKDGNYEVDLEATNQFGSTRSDLFSFVTSLAWSAQSCSLALALLSALMAQLFLV